MVSRMRMHCRTRYVLLGLALTSKKIHDASEMLPKTPDSASWVVSGGPWPWAMVVTFMAWWPGSRWSWWGLVLVSGGRGEKTGGDGSGRYDAARREDRPVDGQRKVRAVSGSRNGNKKW